MSTNGEVVAGGSQKKRRPKTLECPERGCVKKYAKPAKLKEHLLSHSGERPHKCSECTRAFTRADHLKRHQQSTHPSETAEEDKPFRCEFILATEKYASSASESNVDHTSRRDEITNQEVCGKSFWTKDKLNVHVKGHEDQIKKEKEKSKAPKSWTCPYCSETYHKHTQLRTHVVRVHPERLSESTTESGGKVFKPFKCEVEGCDWAFDTLQRLKVHGKVHQEKRYICTHPDHEADQGEYPNFSRWSDFQAHLKEAHPPTCPYEMCHGRVFKSNKNLREHMIIHAEHGDSLVEPKSSREMEKEEELVAIEPLTRGRKRRRTSVPSQTATPERTPSKRLKRSESDVGKDFTCEEEGCDKKFKRRQALAVHHSTAHLGLRPFVCPQAQCERSYGHKHLLQRHIALRHRDDTSPEPALPKFLATKEEEPPSEGSILTGMHTLQKMAKKALACPCASAEVEGEKCKHRFGRVYDLQRHVNKTHDLDLSESEMMLLIADPSGEEQHPEM